MINIDTLTIGSEFKDSDGNIYKVTSNFSQINRLYVELDRVEQQTKETI